LICLLLILIYTGVSAYRASAWKNKLTLLERDTPHLTRSYEAQRIAASIYMEHAQEATDPDLKRTYLQKALIHAQSANDIYPMNMVTHKMEGIIFFNLRDFPASKNAFLQAYQQDTTAPETLEMLGDLSYVEQNFTQASMYYSKASTQDPGSNGLVSKISTILYESGDRDSCLQYNLRLIGTSPELWAPYENLGYYYLEQGDSSQAKMYFNQAKQKGLSDETPL
jgi:tetratricopeptide (TPR) repeat protein